MKKVVLRVLFMVVLLSFIIVYTWSIRTPLYPGQLTLDLNNTTFSTISGATIEYEKAGVVLTLPDIKPFERVIIIPPQDACGQPMETPVFIKHNGKSEIILSEFHCLYGDRYNSDVVQSANAVFSHNKIKGFSTSFLRFKPYFRIIDMSKNQR